MSKTSSEPLRTGDYVTATTKNVPTWAVVNEVTGSVITFANTRKWAREFANHKNGERIAKVHTVCYEVAH